MARQRRVAHGVLVAATVVATAAVATPGASEIVERLALRDCDDCRETCPDDGRDGECPPGCGDCACCPGMLAATLPSLSGFAGVSLASSDVPLTFALTDAPRGIRTRVFRPPRA